VCLVEIGVGRAIPKVPPIRRRVSSGHGFPSRGPREPEIVVRIRKDFGGSDDDPSADEELRYRQPQPVMALPAGEGTVDSEFKDRDEVMQ